METTDRKDSNQFSYLAGVFLLVAVAWGVGSTTDASLAKNPRHHTRETWKLPEPVRAVPVDPQYCSEKHPVSSRARPDEFFSNLRRGS